VFDVRLMCELFGVDVFVPPTQHQPVFSQKKSRAKNKPRYGKIYLKKNRHHQRWRLFSNF
jgi:hypothetical protein